MMLQNQISLQIKTITTKFDPCHIHVILEIEENKYHDNVLIATTFMKLQ
jgi:hypothetical protein